MPYKRREPATIREMNRTDYAGHYTICQFLRDIYHMVDDPSNIEEIKMKCRVGLNMTKAMHKRLDYYRRIEVAKSDEEIEELKKAFEGYLSTTRP